MRLTPALLVAFWLTSAIPLAAQQWDDPTVTSLVQRAIAARQQAQPDTSLVSYQTRAHGFVFFLAQAGRALEGTPRLIKADELDVEVYWHAPATSKQRILGWRDGRWLPTDISYHRDHLGIVTNNFGDLIRLGDGDEVRDVPHPLSTAGPGLYQYRLRDSVEIQGRDRVLRLFEVEVRPRDATQPRVIGIMSLEVESGALARFRFSFTPSSYRESSLEDISVALENAQVDRRWWLPWRQEIEIRRQVTWLDFPARSIIRGRWEIGDYELNVRLSPQALSGPSIGGLRAPAADTTRWKTPLEEAIRDVGRPIERQDLDQVRDEVSHIVADRLLSGTPRVRPGVPAVSDLVRVNRVEGLTLGAGMGVVPSRGLAFRMQAAFGTSDERLTGSGRLTLSRGSSAWSIGAGRMLRDIADRPLLSRLTNSLLAQEGGRDYGDYALLDAVSVGFTRDRGIVDLALGVSLERSYNVRTEATPASGSYRPNPPLAAGDLVVGRMRLTSTHETLDRSRRTALELDLEGGTGDRKYLRSVARAEVLRAAGPGGVLLRFEAGAGTRELPGYRSFAIGGWGTLPGEAFRAWGGRRYLLGHLEYRLPVPFPAIPLGTFATTGRTIIVAPFAAIGSTGGAVADTPWHPSRELRPVTGVALELFQRLLRVEGGVSLITGKFELTVDLAREWWEIL
jgi:hypothetical protein